MKDYIVKARPNVILGHPTTFLFDEAEHTEGCESRIINLPTIDVVLPREYNRSIIKNYYAIRELDYGDFEEDKYLEDAAIKPLKVQIEKMPGGKPITLHEYAQKRHSIFKEIEDAETTLVFVGEKSEVMPFAEAVQKYGELELFAEVYTNALHDRKQPTKVLVF